MKEVLILNWKVRTLESGQFLVSRKLYYSGYALSKENKTQILLKGSV